MQQGHCLRPHCIGDDKKGTVLPATLNPLDLCWMTGQDLCRVHQNITGACDALIDHLGGYLCLVDNRWLEDGIECTNGWRVEADITELKASRGEGLAELAKSILRRICFVFNLSMSFISNILVCFYALIMKRVINLTHLSPTTHYGTMVCLCEKKQSDQNPALSEKDTENKQTWCPSLLRRRFQTL